MFGQFGGVEVFTDKQRCIETVVGMAINIHNLKKSSGQETDNDFRQKLITAQDFLNQKEIDKAFALFSNGTIDVLEEQEVDRLPEQNPYQNIL